MRTIWGQTGTRRGRQGGGAALGITMLALLAPGAAQAQERLTAAAFPSPDTVTASPSTSISFRGVTAGQLGTLAVSGSRSGRHAGVLRAHSDGAGVSFLPKRAFEKGERVTVRTADGVRVTRADGRTFGFTVARAVEGFATVGDSGAPAGIGRFARLKSRPDLAPPAPAVDVADTAATAESIFLAPKRGAGQGGPMILDPAGRIVFFLPLPAGVRADDFRVQSFYGTPALTWWQGRARGGSGRGEGIIADSRYRVLERVPAGNGFAADLHEFLLTDHGTALLLAYNKVRTGSGLAVDSIVQEVELGTGIVRYEWHSLGAVALSDGVVPKPTSSAEADDYFHVNSVAPDLQGGYIISARNTATVYRLSPDGAILWRLGGKHSSFAQGPGAHFFLQHDARLQPDGLLRIFDNSAAGVRKRSRVIWLALDQQAGTATLVRAVSHPADVLAATQGDAEPLAGGGTFVNWGSQGRLSEFDAAGRLVFDLTLPLGFDSYRGSRAPWTGTPTVAPRVRAVAAGTATTVSASWNGSTETRTWRVLAGPDAKTLARVGDTSWTGLETTVAAATTARYVAVEALDATGATLRRSAAVRVSGRG